MFDPLVLLVSARAVASGRLRTADLTKSLLEQCIQHLEDQLQSKLDVSRRIERVGSGYLAEIARPSGNAIGVDAGDGIARHAEERSIGYVESLGAKLQPRRFPDLKILEDG